MKRKKSVEAVDEPALTPDALAALKSALFSRRVFLKGSGALIVSFSAAGLSRNLETAFAQGFSGQGSIQLDSWIAIAQDGTVTAYTGKAELGQGMFTVQTQLIAEELTVDGLRRHTGPCAERRSAGPGVADHRRAG